MKRNGFTLAEILVSVAIIGVATALTIPNLMASYRKDVWGSSLATAVTNFETAMQGMINKEAVYDLFDTQSWRNLQGASLSNSNLKAWASKLSDTLVISDVYKNHSSYYGSEKFSTFASNSGTIEASGCGILTKQGAIYWIEIKNSNKDPNAITEEDAFEKNANLTTVAANSLIIDTNGKEKPNKIGRDVFYFVLGSDGKLYPIGGKDYAVYKNTGTWNSASSTESCVDNTTSSGIGCAGRLIENGYKMDY